LFKLAVAPAQIGIGVFEIKWIGEIVWIHFACCERCAKFGRLNRRW
jgi:hypothetical protein